MSVALFQANFGPAAAKFGGTRRDSLPLSIRRCAVQGFGADVGARFFAISDDWKVPWTF